jgi:O-methyltransferase involved in polyketide biosynthesis
MTSANGRPREWVTLSGVSETALLTLHARTREARRPDPILDDPMAIALHDSIDFDFAKFGPTRQDIALRARAFDSEVRSYLGQHPSPTVVALAEGLQPASGGWTRRFPTASFVG